MLKTKALLTQLLLTWMCLIQMTDLVWNDPQQTNILSSSFIMTWWQV